MEPKRQAAGIDIPAWAAERWPDWFAPERQPFAIDELPTEDLKSLPQPEVVECSPEVRDAFWIYGQRPRVWLTEDEFNQLDRGLRTRLIRAQLRVHQSVGVVKNANPVVWDQARQQGDGYRFVWWPSMIRQIGLDPIIAMIETTFKPSRPREVPTTIRPSRHREVPTRVWEEAAKLLPQARDLAGTFSESSGPEGYGANCFGTVTTAFGLSGSIEDLLDTHAVKGGRDNDPGTILLWRDEEGKPVHAAVTIGEGWALNKPSQAWKSPRFFWTVREVIYHSRYKGCHLQRFTFTR